MANIKLDLSGKTFGFLTAICPVGKNKSGAIIWRCRCSCGKTIDVLPSNLKSGGTKSCGCIGNRKHNLANRNKKHPLYSTWENMRGRCNNPLNRNYKDYGGRGIKVCDRWNDFANFVADIGEKPSPEHSIDRIDNDSGYSPENCRWATKKEQAANRRLRPNEKPKLIA